MIFDIEFAKHKDRLRFEKLYKIKKNEIIVDDNSKCFGAAWLMFRNPSVQVIYNMGFMGYGEPFEILKTCKKKNIKIKSLYWIPINDKESTWKKE